MASTQPDTRSLEVDVPPGAGRDSSDFDHKGEVVVVQISILGPLEVVRDRTVVTPSAPKLRRALSLLALNGNVVVRTDQIIEELWEDNPPASVTTTLQTYVYQLRKLLRLGVPNARGQLPTTAGAPSLRTSAYGYVLSLAPDALDARRFGRLAALGRAQLEAGDPATAAGTLAEALRLWRGPSLVDVSLGPLLQVEALRLEEMHKSALESRIQADLQLGRHHEVLGELTALVAKQPTHEGFHAKLMLALYRAGRRPDALAVYQSLRTALARELGLDPSLDTQRLHRSMLEGDLALEPPPASAEPAAVVVRSAPPSQLPPKGPALVGRDTELAAVLAALGRTPRSAPAVVVVAGPPGCGATALSVHAAHQVRDHHPGGQLYARLLDGDGGRADLGEVLGGFLRALGVPDEALPTSLDERSRMFRSVTADRNVLVLLDDVADIDQLAPLLPSSRASAVLVTSRRRLSTPSISETLHLPPLDVDGSLQLLAAAIGRRRIEREPLIARELVYLCDGLPSALHVAASMLLSRPHWSIARLIAWKRREMDRPCGDPLRLRASVERTYRLAPRAVQTALGQLAGLVQQPVSLGTAASVLGVDEHAAESVLEELVELHLIGAEPPDDQLVGYNYRFLPTLRSISQQLAVGR
ncbi:DNA-binding SARP family transcriptional activator [Micromonospora kangleipakensis]|uniref:DNA-binding SARP family transcriptional activator n=1 Tax=Micromonospora kangleipakensis TaxID=1077942 RepID=A0A4Q8BAP7_9ACTN|nr:DNA-binding SARP family transcriptional activator [Micromonospora kangleipakensis]